MSKDDISISICVPAFNEEMSVRGAVEDLLTALSPVVRGLEIIIVNDASTDLTPQLSDKLSGMYHQVKVIHHKKKLGIGACYRDALAAAQGDYFTWFPADHQNSAQELIRCLPYLRKDTVVICHHLGCDLRSTMRRSISGCYTRLLNGYFRLNLRYYNGLAIFPSSALRSLHLVANGFVFLAESLIKAIHSGCRIVELQAPLKERDHGRSNAFTFFAMRQFTGDISRIFLEQNNR